MAEVAAIGWVMSPIIKAMLDKVTSYSEGHYNWQKHVGGDLRDLKLELSNIQAAVAAAQRRQTRENPHHLEQWLHQIKDAVYDADDVLDEFEYRRMKAEAEKSGSRVSHIFSSSLSYGKRLIGVDDFPTTLKKMLLVLRNVGSRVSELLQVVGSEHDTVDHQGTEIEPGRVTGYILSEDYIFGREKEKEEIVGLLLKPADEPESSNSKRIHVISIVGLGGAGKTTLAQLVYNDSRIAEHFDIRMWVCVSDILNEYRLTREILESASQGEEKHGDTMNFSTLQHKLKQKINSKRFLLVLDDVWVNEKGGEVLNKDMWKKILAPLEDGARNSKILVTTRMGKVAEIFCAMNPRPLEGLSEDNTRSLFNKCVFGDGDLDNYPELREIGLEIIKKLKGSPLATKVVGAMLKDKRDPKRWMEISESAMPDDIMSILRLSYYRLPDHLRPCFTYCNIFPKDWQFQPEKLALLWIAQGYIQCSMGNRRQMLDIGMDYFNELLSRSFFQKVERDSVKCYVMHDLVHDLVQNVSKDAYCFGIGCGKQREFLETVRHLGVVFNSEKEFKGIKKQLKKMRNLKKLHTLIFFGNRWMQVTEHSLDMLKKTSSLRALDFGEMKLLGFPTARDNLLHLRYLNMSYCNFKNLPKSLDELYHLQVLSVYRLRLPESMFRLIKFGELTYFDVSEFLVEKKRGDVMGVRDDIMTVKRDLCFKNLVNVARKEEAVKAELASKQYLYHLELEVSSQGRINKKHDADEEVGKALKPSLILKKLTIGRFSGIQSPSWLRLKWLNSVESIHLTNCQKLKALPPLGHLPLLKKLIIRGMNAVKGVGSGFYGCDDNENEGGVTVGFPSLEELEFYDLPKWSEWSGVEFPVFPRLHQLSIFRCPKLASLPVGALASVVYLDIEFWTNLSFLSSLRRLNVRNCRSEPGSEVALPPSLESLQITESGLSDASLSRCLQGLTSLSELCIVICPSLTSLPSAQVLHHLTAIQRLTISSCNKLTSLGGVGALASLKYLDVMHCPRVKSLPEEGLPASIEFLQLWGCEKLTSLGGLGAIPCLKSLTVGKCPGLKSLPEEGLPASIECLTLDECVELTSLAGLAALPSIKHLKVRECPGVKSLLEEGLPATIEHLGLCGCDPALQQQIRKKEGPEWDKVARISHVYFY